MLLYQYVFKVIGKLQQLNKLRRLCLSECRLSKLNQLACAPMNHLYPF
ncbi:hypothetical protein [Acinetobacter pragensis]|nr:hypothetical protein [Acinetobacter pragensis]